jgi:hypothetical protein
MRAEKELAEKLVLLYRLILRQSKKQQNNHFIQVKCRIFSQSTDISKKNT